MAVDLVLALVSSAPAWSNLASMAYARRAQGRPKVAFLFPLLVAMTVCVAALALVPRSGPGLVAFFVLYALARLLWAGVETVRAVLWSVNYPGRARARITGRITINTSIVVASVGIVLGWLVSHEGDGWRIAILAGCACGFAGTLAFRRLRVRREHALLRAERDRLAEGATFGMAGMKALLARDPAFREYQMAMTVVCLNDVLGMSTLAQVAITTALPIVVMPLAVQAWARYLDRHRVVTFRVRHSRVTSLAVALLVAAVLLRLPWLLWPGALLMGVSLAGGSLGWTLGHNDFAPRGEETRYMALHVTLTGLRGLVAPPLTIGVYHALEWVHAGAGANALLIPFALVLAGAWRFRRMEERKRSVVSG
jgi:hypothetical protein